MLIPVQYMMKRFALETRVRWVNSQLQAGITQPVQNNKNPVRLVV